MSSKTSPRRTVRRQTAALIAAGVLPADTSATVRVVTRISSTGRGSRRG